MNPHVNYVAVLADIDADQLAGRITAQQAGIQRLGAWHDMNAELDQLKAEQAAALVVVEDEIAA